MYEIERGEDVLPQNHAKGGRGYTRFPEFLELRVSRDGTKGDQLVYPDTPYNRHFILQAKGRYNGRNDNGSFKGRRFTHRFEIRGGEPKIIIQRIA